MKYLEKTFTVTAPGTDEYRDNWERIFGKKGNKPEREDVAHDIKSCPRCSLNRQFLKTMREEFGEP